MHYIQKRKPKHASAEFWGGTKASWKDGKKTEEKLEGWLEEMCKKTLVREAYSAKNIPRDPTKIDEAYQFLKLREAKHAEALAQAEIDENANKTVIDVTAAPATPKAEIPAENKESEIGAAF